LSNSKLIEQSEIEIKDIPVPYKVYSEYRSSIRASIGKKAAILRMPRIISTTASEKHRQWFFRWLVKQMDKHPDLLQRFDRRLYRTGDPYIVDQDIFLLDIIEDERKSHRARLNDRTIEIKLSSHDTTEEQRAAIPTLLSRVLSAHYLPQISDRVHWWNDNYFQEDINDIKLKLNLSNWGSCSMRRNINLSSRLLFAPESVRDYVMVHELAHLKEMNHSPRFWRIVQSVMADYKEKEKWLKENGHLCYF
jgi:predicted metal-dependent hydrolase